MPRPLPLVSASRKRPALPLLSSLPAAELADLLVRSGGTPTQARSAVMKVQRHVHGVDSGESQPAWDSATFDALGIGAWAHRALLTLDPVVSLDLVERAPAHDGSERLVLSARDGSLIETVIIPGPARTTVCISSQVGCARACTFCETGKLGLVRQLDAGEIVDQVRVARALWGSKSPAIQNVVFMGMGEPFDNLVEVARATHVLTDDPGIKLPPSRITVSTVGVADKIATFFRTARAELAVSLNAPTDAKRSRIMPVNDRFGLDALLGALRSEVPRGHKVLFEYVLIRGFNDSGGDADELAARIKGMRARVNVIPVNPGPDPEIQPPSVDALNRFVARLVQHKLVTLVRRPRGRDIGGACGQLAGALRERVENPFLGETSPIG